MVPLQNVKSPARPPTASKARGHLSAGLRAAAWVLLFGALVLAGPLAAYQGLPECCKDDCDDACPIDARRIAGKAHDAHATATASASPPSCHAAEAPPRNGPAPEASAHAPQSTHHGDTFLNAPSRCGEEPKAPSRGERAAATLASSEISQIFLPPHALTSSDAGAVRSGQESPFARGPPAVRS